MKHLKSILIPILVVIVLVAMGLAAKRFERARVATAQEAPTIEVAPWPVQVSPIRQDDLRATYGTLGTIESLAQVQVAGQFPGAILEVGPREGQRVEVGELLARIDTTEFDADLAAREAELDAAKEESSRLKLEFEREKALLAEEGSTQSKVDASQSAAVGAQKRVAALEKSIEAMRTRRSYARVTSPVAGVIKLRQCEVGDLCAAYHPLFLIDAKGAARLTLHIPAGLSDSISTGTEVDFQNGSKTVKTQISRIHPELSPMSLITVDADLDELPAGLHSGSRVEATLLLKQLKAAIIVPKGAIFGQAGHESILRIRADSKPATVELIGVDPLLEADAGTAVQVRGEQSLKAGDQIVVGRPDQLAKLRTGDPVQVFGAKE